MKWLSNIISGIVAPVVKIFIKDKELQIIEDTNRRDVAVAIGNRNVAKINAQAKRFEINGDIEKKKIDASVSVDNQVLAMRRNSWLDEIVIMLILLPAVLVFVPNAQPYIKHGFLILQTLPDFYQALLVLVVVMTVGGVGLIRDLLGKFKPRV